MSQGKTSRPQIESILKKTVGGFIDRLDNEYDIISKLKPVGAKDTSRNQKYVIKDNFINFWFRFIYKYRSSVETGNFENLKQIVNRDFSSYSGYYFEKLYHEIFQLSNNYNIIGNVEI